MSNSMPTRAWAWHPARARGAGAFWLVTRCGIIAMRIVRFASIARQVGSPPKAMRSSVVQRQMNRFVARLTWLAVIPVALVASGEAWAQAGNLRDRVKALQTPAQRSAAQSAQGTSTQVKADKAKATAKAGTQDEPVQRTRDEIDAMIDEAGKTPPQWWDSVTLRYPKTLDLSWPKPPEGSDWDTKKNVGQYLWSVINENPGRWKEGVRFLHYLLKVNQDRPATLRQTMARLGSAYHELMQDWARAAFWWQKSGANRSKGQGNAVHLAHCYWMLGSKEMASSLLNNVERKQPVAAIKLWAEMGQLSRALRLARALARTNAPDIGWLAAGDACRTVGKHRAALTHYRKVAKMRKGSRRLEQCQARAKANIAALKVYELLDLSRVPDGAYRDSSVGYAGDIEVEVTVKAARIETVQVVSHKEKQSFTSIPDTTAMIVRKQGVKGVDTTTGATITAEAIINATAKALAKGMK